MPTQKRGNANANVMPLYIRPTNLYQATLEDKKRLKHVNKAGVLKFTEMVKQDGYDGAELTYSDGTQEICIFNPNQVRSIHAAFDPDYRESSNLLASKAENKLLAPNGKPSNLNAMQWAQVRTPEFIKWFGDWETAQIIHELKNGKPFIVSGNEFADFSEPLNMKKLRSEAITYGESNIVGKYENKYSGIKLEVRRGGIDESIQHGSGPEKLKALASIKDILVNGYVVYDGINPKNKKGRLVAISKRVDISGKSFVVTVGLREDANGRLFYDHELLDTRRAEGLSSQSSEGLSPQHPAPTSTRLNDYYIRFIEKDINSSKVVDENGEPLVVYHGGKGGIDVFDPNLSGTVKPSDWGKGVYFTPLKWQANGYKEDYNLAYDKVSNDLWDKFNAKAKEFGTAVMYKSLDLQAHKITQSQYDELEAIDEEWRQVIEEGRKNGNGEVYSVFLNMKNPEYESYQGITDSYLAERAKDSGKDGIVITNDEGNLDEIVAFNPNQIKSATENNGDFSESNNIKFSRSTPSNTPADNSAMRSFFDDLARYYPEAR